MMQFIRLAVTCLVVPLGLAAVPTALAADPDMRCAQEELNALGHEAGVADGLIGSKTRTAAEA